MARGDSLAAPAPKAVKAAEAAKACACPKILKPVCFEGKQFSNSCQAKCAGIKTWVNHPCGECICPSVWDPVCAKGKTFGNACEANCQGFLAVKKGACPVRPAGLPTSLPRSPVGPFPTRPSPVWAMARGDSLAAPTPKAVKVAEAVKACACPKILKPVCFEGKQFSNSCQAKCAGIKTWVNRPCGECICPSVWEPVCAKGKTFGNSCEAACQGFLAVKQGECLGTGATRRQAPVPPLAPPRAGDA